MIFNFYCIRADIDDCVGGNVRIKVSDVWRAEMETAVRKRERNWAEGKEENDLDGEDGKKEPCAGLSKVRMREDRIKRDKRALARKDIVRWKFGSSDVGFRWGLTGEGKHHKYGMCCLEFEITGDGWTGKVDAYTLDGKVLELIPVWKSSVAVRDGRLFLLSVLWAFWRFLYKWTQWGLADKRQERVQMWRANTCTIRLLAV